MGSNVMCFIEAHFAALARDWRPFASLSLFRGRWHLRPGLWNQQLLPWTSVAFSANFLVQMEAWQLSDAATLLCGSTWTARPISQCLGGLGRHFVDAEAPAATYGGAAILIP